MRQNISVLSGLLCLIFTTFSFINTAAQTTLSPGDIAILGLRSDSPDDFAFVALVDLEAGTEIKFTDNGVLMDGQLRKGESTITFTVPIGGITTGTVITQLNNSSFFSASLNNLAATGDQVIAYQEDAEKNITFIFAIQSNSTVWQTTEELAAYSSTLPPGLTNGLTAVAAGKSEEPDAEYDNIWYSGTVTSGTKKDILSAIGNSANWSRDNNDYGPIEPSFSLSPEKGEPTNHVSNFNVSAIALNSAELTWTDATGETTPDGYLIKGAIKGNSITRPIDGIPEKDGTLIYNVKAGVQNCTLKGLTPSSDYEFRIFPYTNSGGSIDYKIDTDAPSISFSTLEGQIIESILISRNCDPYDNYSADRYAEIYNAGNISVNLNGWKLENIQNGNMKFEWLLGGTISPGQTIICGTADATSQTISPDIIAAGSLNSWNGEGGDGTILKNAEGEIIDNAVQKDTEKFSDKQMVRKLTTTNPSPTYNEDEWNFTRAANASVTVPGFRGTVWNGSSNSVNWETESNWNNGLPDENIDVVIPSGGVSMPTVNGESACKNITIQSDAWLKEASKLTIHGTARVERSITTKKFHYLTSPLKNATSNDFAGCYLYESDEANFSSWKPLTAGVNLGDMKGYCVMSGTWDENENTWTAEKDSILISFEGQLKTGEVTFDLSFTPQSSGIEQGWNLVANPYVAPINASEFASSHTDIINNAVYVYDGSYYQSVVDGVVSHPELFNGIIAPMQGFFVQAKSNAGTLSINESFEVKSLPSFKSEEIVSLIRLRISNEAYSDATVIRHKEGTTISFDPEFDAWKLIPSNSPTPLIYSSPTANEKLLINSVPEGWQSINLPINVEIKETGIHSLSAQLENIPAGAELYIEHNGKLINLNTDEYTFEATPGMYSMNLKSSSLTTTSEPFSRLFIVHAGNGQLSVQTSSSGEITIFDMEGNQILTHPVSDKFTVFPFEKKGIFIIQLTSNQQFITRKVIIR